MTLYDDGKCSIEERTDSLLFNFKVDDENTYGFSIKKEGLTPEGMSLSLACLKDYIEYKKSQ
jgi:hypothetical protein